MATDGGSEQSSCVTCGEPVEARSSADCNWCNKRFHLNQRNDMEAKDCGQVWIDEQYMALQFACDTCLAGAGDASREGRRASIRQMPARHAEEPTPRRRRYVRRT